MKRVKRDNRAQMRYHVDPLGTRTFLQFIVEDKRYRFNLLDKSQGGIGMLVMNEETDVLNALRIGDKLNLECRTAEDRVEMNSFEIRHITPMRKGDFIGDHLVGLSLLPTSK